MELRHSEIGKKYMEWMLSNQPSELKHYGVRGQKWGVRRYQDQTGRNTELGLKRRRSGYDETEPKTLDELKKRDLEKGYVDENGNVTKAGHAYEKKRRAKLSEEETITELEEAYEFWWKEGNNSPETEYRSKKLYNELYKYVGYGYMGDGITPDVKKAYTNLRSVNKQLHRKRPSEFTESERNELASAYEGVSSAILKELGYKDTPDTRKHMVGVWYVD